MSENCTAPPHLVLMVFCRTLLTKNCKLPPNVAFRVPMVPVTEKVAFGRTVESKITVLLAWRTVMRSCTRKQK
jgi:hypothetical protein